MTGVLRAFVIPFVLALAFPAMAQEKTGVTQEMAKPGESTVAPTPKASPIGVVQEVPLPRAGGVLVFGGTRGVGLEAVKVLVAMKEQVTVVTHSSPNSPELKALGVTVMSGDALNPESLKDIFTNGPYRVVISTLGGKRGEPRPDFEGNKNAIDATKKTGIPRFIMVTSIGTGDSQQTPPWIARWFLKEILVEKTKAEEYLKASGLDYTIIRPGGLLDKPASGKATVTPDIKLYSWVARADVGKIVAETVKNDDTIKKTLSTYDPTRTSFTSMFMD